MSDKTQGKGRTRNYACLVYPESAPANWLDLLRDLKVKFFVSPLHDSDVNPDGVLKKAHYHVLLMFDGVKTVEQFETCRDSFGGVGSEKVNSVRGYARYLCHLDNPEKSQYSPDDVVAFGEDYQLTISSPTDKYTAIREMLQFCEDNGITLFCDLMTYAMNNNELWYRTLCDNGTYPVKEWLKSFAYKHKAHCD